MDRLGLVWLQAFLRGSLCFPWPFVPRVQLPRWSPPSHLDAREVGFPRRFRVSPRESVPPLERWGTSSPTWSRDRRRRRWERPSRSPSSGEESSERNLLPSPSGGLQFSDLVGSISPPPSPHSFKNRTGSPVEPEPTSSLAC
jgi:hypothetical protein